MRSARFLLALAAVVTGLAHGGAGASPVTFRFSGVIGSVHASLGGVFAVGDAASFSLTVDATGVPGRRGESRHYPVLDMAARFGATDFSPGSALGPFMLVNDSPGNPALPDGLTARMLPVGGPTLAGLASGAMGVELFDLDSTAFDDDSPPTSLALADFEIARMGFDYCTQVIVSSSSVGCTSPRSVVANIRSVEIIRVPEPASLCLASLGLLCGGWWRQRRRAGPVN